MYKHIVSIYVRLLGHYGLQFSCWHIYVYHDPSMLTVCKINIYNRFIGFHKLTCTHLTDGLVPMSRHDTGLVVRYCNVRSALPSFAAISAYY